MFKTYRNVRLNVANLRTCSKCDEGPLFLTEEDLKRHDDRYHAVKEVDQNLQKEKNENKELEEALNYMFTLLVRGKTKLEDQYDDMEIKLEYLQKDEKTNRKLIDMKIEEMKVIQAAINVKIRTICRIITEYRRIKGSVGSHTENQSDESFEEVNGKRQILLIIIMNIVVKYEEEISGLRFHLNENGRELEHVYLDGINKVRNNSEIEEGEAAVLKEEVNELKEKLAIANEKIGLQQRQLDKLCSVNKEYVKSKESVNELVTKKKDLISHIKKLNMKSSTPNFELSKLKEYNCDLSRKNKIEKTVVVEKMIDDGKSIDDERLKNLNEELEKTKQVKKKLNKLVESLKKKLTKAEKKNKKDEDHGKECGIKMEEYVKEIKELKVMLQQKSEIHQLQEEEYHLKEEESERDLKTIISIKDEKIALMEEQLKKLNNEVQFNKQLYELSMNDLLKTEKAGMLSDELEAVEYDRY